MELKSNIKDSLLLFPGIIFILYILGIRLLRNKLPQELPVINSSLKFFMYILIPLGLFVAIFIILYKKRNSNSKSWFTNTLQNIITFYWQSLQLLDNTIKSKIPPEILGHNLLKISKIYATYLELTNKTLFLIFYITFNFMPKILFLLIFAYDVFYMKKFIYIYYNAWLLLIPSLFNYLNFTLKEFAEFNIDHYTKEILFIISKDNILISNPKDILNSIYQTAYQIFYHNRTEIVFMELYVRLADLYCERNSILDEIEWNRVLSLRHNEFVLFRLLVGNYNLFMFIRKEYDSLLNSLYLFLYALLWIILIVQQLCYP